MGWSDGQQLTALQANQLDIDHANAIDGSAGGSYTLSAPLTINGTVNTELKQYYHASVSCSGLTDNSLLTLTHQSSNGAFALAANAIQVPSAGTWLVMFCAVLTNGSATSGIAIPIEIRLGSTTAALTLAKRFSTTTTDAVSLAAHVAVEVTTPGTQAVALRYQAGSVGSISTPIVSASWLTIRRLV